MRRVFTIGFILPMSPRPFVVHDDRITEQMLVDMIQPSFVNKHEDILHIVSDMTFRPYDGYMEIYGDTDAPFEMALTFCLDE